MSDIYDEISSTTPPTPAASPSSPPGDKVEAAKEQAGQLKEQALDSSAKVTGTAKNEAANVVGEAKAQAKDLFAQTQSELKDQAGVQQQRVAAGLRSVSDELGSMANSSEGGGVASELVQQAASRAGSIATWLEGRDPGSLLSDVRSYAARKPGTFIAAAAIAGLLAGRLTRSLVANTADEKAAEKEAESTSTPEFADVVTTASAPTPAYAPAEPTYVAPVVPSAPATTAYTAADAHANFDDLVAPTGTTSAPTGTDFYYGDHA
ncbi:hypothetical protein B7R22_02245 [Subtercola boreus]|uniref:Uncharacterized protein n=1 Tax=Subtercola boreus TaxID=120213 RepID=A0A3E0W4I4_9MICO|nr:CsbD family protein [Subtercola boreus]RFA16891.1 hypothetical protein B7R22_02245 [Subtercola boreus]